MMSILGSFLPVISSLLYYYSIFLSLLIVTSIFGYVLSRRVRFWIICAFNFIPVIVGACLTMPVAVLRPFNPWNFVVCQDIVRKTQHLLTMEWQLKGSENAKPNKNYIIISNHQSSFDAIGLTTVIDPFLPVVPALKSTLKYAYPIGPLCWLSGTVFIDRGTAKGRQELEEGLEACKRKKCSLWIFPEGTRNRDSATLLPFKKGAFHIAVEAQIPILPVVFSSYSSFYSSREARIEPGICTLTVLPEISVEGLGPKDVSDLCESTRKMMQEVFTRTTRERKEKKG